MSRRPEKDLEFGDSHVMVRKVANRIDNPVFIFSSGRSGSTWLQRVINAHPRLTIWGEHYAFLKGLASSYNSVVHCNTDNIPDTEAESNDRRKLIGALSFPDCNSEWIGSFSKELLRDSYHNLIDYLFARDLPEGIRWGFKEVRYPNGLNATRLTRYAPTSDTTVFAFLNEIYPRSQFIFLSREEVEVCTSAIYAFAGIERWLNITQEQREILIINLISAIRQNNHAFATFCRTLQDPGRHLSIDYGEFVDDFAGQVRRVCAFLGIDIGEFGRKVLQDIESKKVYATSDDLGVAQMVKQVIKRYFPKNHREPVYGWRDFLSINLR